VWDKTCLTRRPDRDETSPTLGELLAAKAAQGVNVLMLVWDDTTNNYGLHSGLMATHDQETYDFFKETEVHCVLCPRQGGTEDSYLQVCGLGL
jgi:phospholipase D1/2